MPRNWKDEIGNERVPQRTWLKMPVIGMESEFNVWLDEVEIDPKKYWKHPSAFIDRELLPREKSSLQLPTGGAVYFDRGVIEVVTPVIELGPHSTARMVRNRWEQIGFVREAMSWPTYDLSLLQKLPIPVVAGVVPGKHTTRKGWLTKDFHYPQSPYTSDINAPIWTTQYGKKRSIRQMAKEVACYFQHSIRAFSDPFSFP